MEEIIQKELENNNCIIDDKGYIEVKPITRENNFIRKEFEIELPLPFRILNRGVIENIEDTIRTGDKHLEKIKKIIRKFYI